jgi:hypothetical protein
MKYITQKRLIIFLKFIEFSLIGFGTYYAAVSGKNANPLIFIFIYLLLFLVGTFHIRQYVILKRLLKCRNINLLVRYFYEQNYFDPNADVRLTIHKKLNDNTYQQYIDYFPTGGGKGKKHAIIKGIVQYAFREAKGEFSESFGSNAEKLEKLVSKYNFRTDEAKSQLTDGELSYYCSPIIVGDENVWGVLYMKARRTYTFPAQSKLEGSEISKNAKVLIKMIEVEIA